MNIGILALQGGFAEHAASLSRLGVGNFLIRKKSDIDRPIDGLIIPGGESTVIRRLLLSNGLFDPIDLLIREGLPVFGTCAGLILLARKIEGEPGETFAAIPISVRRNGYGRQLGSYHTEAAFTKFGEIPMTFIRAPQIEDCPDEITILARVGGHIVAARYRNVLVTAFHPELTENLSVHTYFLSLIRGETTYRKL